MRSPKYGNILISRYADIRGNTERIEYRIEGGPYFLIDYTIFDQHIDHKRGGGKIRIGPYSFRILENRAFIGQYVIAQDKWPLWWLAVAWHKINKLPDLFYRRTIITLAVWRLADYYGATVPCIGDVHLVQKVKKILKRVRK